MKRASPEFKEALSALILALWPQLHVKFHSDMTCPSFACQLTAAHLASQSDWIPIHTSAVIATRDEVAHSI